MEKSMWTTISRGSYVVLFYGGRLLSLSKTTNPKRNCRGASWFNHSLSPEPKPKSKLTWIGESLDLVTRLQTGITRIPTWLKGAIYLLNLKSCPHDPPSTAEV